jgi:hypothetical protein
VRKLEIVAGLLMVASLTLCGCGSSEQAGSEGAPPSVSPSARLEIVEALRLDGEAERHSSDGGGSVRFESAPPPVAAGRASSWSFIYRAGPEGIVEDGWLFFQAPPFWGWSTPQALMPDRPGYTQVETAAEGVVLEPETIDQQLLAVRIRGRALLAGEEIRLVYGAGEFGATADRYAESESCFFFAVDGDGDGVRSLLPEPVCTVVIAGPAARLALSLPSTGKPGGEAVLTVAVLDAVGNRVTDWTGAMSLASSEIVDLPEQLEFELEHQGARKVAFETGDEGVVVVSADSGTGLQGRSNPLKVGSKVRRVLWADLHGHSGLTDGTGTPKDYFRYAREVSALDVVALTDHDHWGMQPLALHPELWEEIRRESELFNRPGAFVTLLGYEWTSWIHGHRHVLYFSGQGQIFSSVDPAYESPLQLWDALREADALTFAHHSAGGPIATNWEIPPDPELEPVTEIVSVHGSSEALDSPATIYSPVAGNFVRDVLQRGYVFGFVGSGDSHDGHPGFAHFNAASGGMAAILSEKLTRESVKDALQHRRVYATNGPRILLEAELADWPMGSVIDQRALEALAAQEKVLRVTVTGTSSVARVELIRTGKIEESVDCAAQPVCTATFAALDLDSGDYLYVRAIQSDGGAAWSSPFYVR